MSSLRPSTIASRPGNPAEADAARASRQGALRILGWSTLAAVLIAALGLLSPVDDYLRMARNLARVKAPSGEIVIVAIDDRSLEHRGAWPWPRRTHATLIERLNAAGASRIYFDVAFATKSKRADDAAFATALRRAGNVSIAAMRVWDAASGTYRFKLPRREFASHANVVSVAIKHSSSLSVWRMDYQTDTGDGISPTMSASLANWHGKSGESFTIDYAINPRRVPVFSAVDVLDGKLPPGALKGKDVVIGPAATEMGDVYYLPGFGQINGVFVNVIAAETLKAGGTKFLVWPIPLAVGFLLMAIHLWSASRWIACGSLAIAIAGLSVGPLIAEQHGIFYEILPAMVLVAASAGSRAWSNFRRSYKVRGDINAVSGLPNLNALRSRDGEQHPVVVAARVRNFAEISSSLPPESERSLVDQIVARLALGARGAQVHQGDEGIFVWTTAPDVAGPEQLDALHALFRSPALVDGRPIDLSITFGIDGDGSRTLANRIGATLVAADEAAREGARWKAYDPAKLADVEWKLSLLGRLDAAIDSGEVWVAYQPQLNLADNRICGAEALVRWSHPEKGEISPMEFVLAAEQHNRIDKLTAFVLHDAIRAAATFYREGQAFDVAVNISARLLEKPGLVAIVRDMLADAGLPPERLTLEVTESAAMTSGRASIRTLEELGSLGINVSIDDYGTGFSTLEYFKNIPATEVKIDRSFVSAIDRNASDRLMVRSTIELAHSLDRSVVAEGVETQDILTELRKLGCDKAQGYLIGRPMKLVNLMKLLRDDATNRAA